MRMRSASSKRKSGVTLPFYQTATMWCMKRRSFLSGPLLGLWPFSKLSAARSANVYQELGVRPVINCKGAYTMIGASKQWPELHAAMAEASQHFVFLEELQERIGERL